MFLHFRLLYWTQSGNIVVSLDWSMELLPSFSSCDSNDWLSTCDQHTSCNWSFEFLDEWLLNLGFGKQWYLQLYSLLVRFFKLSWLAVEMQKQPPRSNFRERCFENMQQIFRSTLILKGDFNKVASGNGYCCVTELSPFPDVIIISFLWAAIIIDTGEPVAVEINTN